MPSPGRALSRALIRVGYEVRRIDKTPPEYPSAVAATIAAVSPYTMTSPARIASLCDAVNYVLRYDIPGSIVECGVWAGGSMMAVARTLIEAGATDRQLFLYDTFTGMSEPTDLDLDSRGVPAKRLLSDAGSAEEIWCRASLPDVRRNLGSTGYPSELTHYVEGPVESTVPRVLPGPIAVLRLDTDWYESTRHELQHLTPLISRDGILIIDDYGHWQGARKAVDEWLETVAEPVFLARIDYTGRIAVIRRSDPR